MGKIAEKITLRSQRGYIGNRRVLFPRVRSVTQRIMEAFEHGRNGYLHNYAASYLNQLSTGTTPVTAVTDPVGLLMDARLGLQASTKGAYMAGAAGTYLSSPDSVAASITGDIDIDVEVNLTDWTPATNNWLISKNLNAGQFAYDFRVNAGGGALYFRTTGDGTTARNLASTVAPTIADGAKLFVRVKRISATGAGTFYTSTDGVSWTQLGAEVAGTAGAIFDSTDELRIGAESTVTSTGKIYKARIYNGIRESGGTLAVNYNGTDYSTGSTLTSSTTGEVWTLNGATYIAPDGNHAIQATAGDRPTWQVDATGHYYLSFPGSSVSLTSATGGGGTAGFFWCGVVQPTGGAGTSRYIFDDQGTLTGYRINLGVTNVLAFRAGNGAAETLCSSPTTLDVGTKYLVTVWDDGINLNVQIGSGVVTSVARPVVSAGTAGFTLGKQNGVAGNYLIGNLYPSVYWKGTAGTAAERADAQAYCRMMGGL